MRCLSVLFRAGRNPRSGWRRWLRRLRSRPARGAAAWVRALRRLLEVGQVDPRRGRPAVAGIDPAAVPAFEDRMPRDQRPVFEDPHFRGECSNSAMIRRASPRLNSEPRCRSIGRHELLTSRIPRQARFDVSGRHSLYLRLFPLSVRLLCLALCSLENPGSSLFHG